MRKIWQGGLLAMVLVAGAPAAWAESTQTNNPDPWEGFNRRMFRFNDRLDTHVVKPAAIWYRRVTPQFVMDGIGNFFDNLAQPITVINEVLQGKVRNAAADTGRFVLNSTVGVLGLIDVASHAKLPPHHKDFGMTLGVWGSGPGPYLMLPFMGPSTLRDLGGRGVDWVDNPVTVKMTLTTAVVLKGADSFNQRANLLPMEGIIQGDKYLFVRDLYLQHREFEIKDGKVDADPFLDDSEDGGSSPTTPATVVSDNAASASPAGIANSAGATSEAAIPTAGQTPATTPAPAAGSAPVTP